MYSGRSEFFCCQCQNRYKLVPKIRFWYNQFLFCLIIKSNCLWCCNYLLDLFLFISFFFISKLYLDTFIIESHFIRNVVTFNSFYLLFRTVFQKQWCIHNKHNRCCQIKNNLHGFYLSHNQHDDSHKSNRCSQNICQKTCQFRIGMI